MGWEGREVLSKEPPTWPLGEGGEGQGLPGLPSAAAQIRSFPRISHKSLLMCSLPPCGESGKAFLVLLLTVWRESPGKEVLESGVQPHHKRARSHCAVIQAAPERPHARLPSLLRRQGEKEALQLGHGGKGGGVAVQVQESMFLPASPCPAN